MNALEINAGHLAELLLSAAYAKSLLFKPHVLNSPETTDPDPLLDDGDHLGLQNTIWFYNKKFTIGVVATSPSPSDDEEI
jgi:hypothetical protein